MIVQFNLTAHITVLHFSHSHLKASHPTIPPACVYVHARACLLACLSGTKQPATSRWPETARPVANRTVCPSTVSKLGGFADWTRKGWKISTDLWRPVARKPLSDTRTRKISSKHQSAGCCSSCVEDVWASGGTLLCGCPSVASVLSVRMSVCCAFALLTPKGRLSERRLRIWLPWNAKNPTVLWLFFFVSHLPRFTGPRLLPSSRQPKLAFSHLVSCFQIWFSKIQMYGCVS